MKQSELNNAMYQNASMCCSAINQVLPQVQNDDLKQELSRQLNSYHNEINSVVSSMRKDNCRPRQLPVLKRLSSKAGIALSLARDNSTEHIAQMMIQGTNMGVIEINRALNAAKGLSPSSARKTKEILEKEQRNIDALKKFL